MRTRILILRLKVCALVCLCAAAHGQEFSVTKLVRDVAQKAESAKESEFEGDLLLGGQRGSKPGVVIAQAKVHLAECRGCTGEAKKVQITTSSPRKILRVILSSAK